jgi:Cu-processing system permease protein
MAEARVVALFARKELREALRARVLLAYGAALVALVVGLSSFAFASGHGSGFAGFGRTTATLVNVVLLLVPLVALLQGSQSIAGERESGVLDALLVQPVSRAEVFLGKALGLAVSLSATLVLAFGAAALVVARAAHDSDAGALLGTLGATILLALASLSIGLLISSVSRSRGRAVALALVAWFALAVLADLGAIGATTALGLRGKTVFFLATANPLEAFKVLATLSISPRLDVLGPAGVAAVQTWGRDGARAWLALVLALWTLIPGAASFAVFVRSKEA